MFDPGNWQAITVTIGIVCLCVIVHYEALGLISRSLLFFHRPRPRMIIVILSIVMAHVIEVWLFAAGYYALIHVAGIGSLQAIDPTHVGDYFYYSAVVYSTLGFGDVIPTGPVRFMTGMEAIMGLVLITWSASFAFIEMQRNWRV